MTIERAIEDSESCGLVGGGKMGIAKRHLEILVSEQIFDCRQVHPSHDKVRSECVAKIVEPEILDPCPAQRSIKRCLDILKPLSFAVRKDIRDTHTPYNPL